MTMTRLPIQIYTISWLKIALHDYYQLKELKKPASKKGKEPEKINPSDAIKKLEAIVDKYEHQYHMAKILPTDVQTELNAILKSVLSASILKSKGDTYLVFEKLQQDITNQSSGKLVNSASPKTQKPSKSKQVTKSPNPRRLSLNLSSKAKLSPLSISTLQTDGLFSPRGNKKMTKEQLASIKVEPWDFVKKPPFNPKESNPDQSKAFGSVAVSKDGEMIAAVENQTQLCLYYQNELNIISDPNDQVLNTAWADNYNALTFSQDNKYLLGARFDGALVIWDLTKKEERLFPSKVYPDIFKEGDVREQKMAALPDGKVAISYATLNGPGLGVFDPKTGKLELECMTNENFKSIAYSNGKIIGLQEWKRHEIDKWHKLSITVFDYPTDEARTDRIISPSLDQKDILFKHKRDGVEYSLIVDQYTSTPMVQYGNQVDKIDLETGTLSHFYTFGQKIDQSVRDICIAPSGKSFAVTIADADSVAIYAMDNPEKVAKTINTYMPRSMFLRDSKLIVVGQYEVNTYKKPLGKAENKLDEDGTLKLSDRSTRSPT